LPRQLHITWHSIMFSGRLSYPRRSSRYERQAAHERHTTSRTNSVSRSPSPPTLPRSTIVQSHVTFPSERESDAECWERMLALQREYHCYNSARLEAAVEALENGWPKETIPIPSRLCLNLLNEDLKSQIKTQQEGFGP